MKEEVSIEISFNFLLAKVLLWVRSLQLVFSRTRQRLYVLYLGLLSYLPSGDKTFSASEKGRWKIQISKVSKPFLERNKTESKNNWTTFCSAFAVPLVDKTFSAFLKGRWNMGILKVTKRILEHNKMENKNNWTTFCSPFAVPSGNKTFLAFRKGRWKIQLLKVSKPFLEHNKMESKNN